MEYDILDTQIILIPTVGLGQLTELFSQAQALADAFRRDEVFSYFDRRANIVNLMRTSCRNEDSLTHALHKTEATHALFFPKAPAQGRVEVVISIMDLLDIARENSTVAVWYECRGQGDSRGTYRVRDEVLCAFVARNTPEEGGEFRLVFRCPDVPDGSSAWITSCEPLNLILGIAGCISTLALRTPLAFTLLFVGRLHVHHEIDGIRHVHMQASGSIGLLGTAAQTAICHIHLGPKVRRQRVWWQSGDQIESASTTSVERLGQRLHEVSKMLREQFGIITGWRPVLEFEERNLLHCKRVRTCRRCCTINSWG
mmetsp:Transcript_16213/g.41698  ORF Transcript_16213/g.41698 Transcript_16213/m.41698 type:complete len:313 (-) Transcript_16213:32-970(-)